MAKSDETTGAFAPALRDHSICEPPASAAAGIGAGFDRPQLVAILTFLNHEIGESGAMLHDLAGRLSQEFCALSQSESLDDMRDGMVGATIALQNEDRIQQRLHDLRTLLSILEQALLRGSPAHGAELDHAIIEQLRLEEIRAAFARSIGIAVPNSPASPCDTTPSIGDIDLF